MNVTQLRELIATELSDVHTSLPGVVISYDGNRAVVKPALPKQLASGDVLQAPQIVNVPVCFPVGDAGKAQITVPLKGGDPVLLHFSERALESWLSGSDDAPDDPRQFDLTDAFASPVMRFAAADTENVCIMYGAGTIKLAPSGDLTITVPTMTVTADQTTFDSPVTVNGPLVYTNGISGAGGTGSTMTITGNVDIDGEVNIDGGSLTHNGKNIGSDHTHNGVVAGGDETGEPV